MSAASQLPPEAPSRLPLLAVRDVVVFPHMSIPLSVGREKSIKALEAAQQAGKLVAVTAQKSAAVEDPKESDFYAVGVLCEIAHFMRMPDGTLKVFLQGIRRVRLASTSIRVSM